jgi:hypothetical protein
MKPNCYHGVKAFGIIPRTVCNFSSYPTIIAKLFGSECPFEYDKEHCVGFVPLQDPREKCNEDEQ